MKGFAIMISALVAKSVLCADTIGIIGGQDFNDPITAYAALVSSSGTTTTLIDTLPPDGTITSVAISSSGTVIIGGNTLENGYAAFVSGNQVFSLDVASQPPIFNVAINASDVGLIGGGLGGSNPLYLAFATLPGNLIPLNPPVSTGRFQSLAINDSGTAIISFLDSVSNPFTILATYPSNTTTTLSGLSNVPIESVAINKSGTAILGGQDRSGPIGYAALLFPPSTTPTPIAGIGAPVITLVTINNSGTGLISDGTNYVAFVSPSGVLGSPLPFPMTIRTDSIALNNSGTALIGGVDNMSVKAYAAFISPSGVVTPIQNIPLGNGDILSVAINDAGVGLIGGFITFNTPFAALVSPSGELTFLNTPTSGTIFSVALRLLTNNQIPIASLTGNNLVFANYVNEFAPEKTFYFIPSELDGSLSKALESAAPTRNAISFYTASHNLFYFTTTLATHLRWQQRLQPQSSSEFSQMYQASEALLASRCLPCKATPISNNAPYTLWFDAIGALAYQKEQNQTPGFNPATLGAIFAFETSVTTSTRVGASISYLFTHIHEKEGAGHSNINQEDLFLYASWDNRRFYIDGAIGGGLFQTDQVRNIHMSGFQFKSSSHPDGWQLIPHLELGYNATRKLGEADLYFNPFLMLDWANAWQNSYREKGSGPFNAAQKHHHASLLRTEVGCRFYQTWNYTSSILILQEKGSYINTQSFGTGRVNAFLVGSPGSFVVETLTSAQNLGAAQFALTFDPLSPYYPITTLFYQGEFGSKYQSHEVNLEFAWNF